MSDNLFHAGIMALIAAGLLAATVTSFSPPATQSAAATQARPTAVLALTRAAPPVEVIELPMVVVTGHRAKPLRGDEVALASSN